MRALAGRAAGLGAGLAGADLAAEAEEYCRDIGLTDEEISALRTNLGGEKAGHTKKPDYVSFAVFVTALFIGLGLATLLF